MHKQAAQQLYTLICSNAQCLCNIFQIKMNFFAILDYCSHRRSVYLFAESLTQERNFDAIALKNSSVLNLSDWSKFKTNTFSDEQNVVPMGIACPETASGVYYLQTNNEVPFGRAVNGVRYDSSV